MRMRFGSLVSPGIVLFMDVESRKDERSCREDIWYGRGAYVPMTQERRYERDGPRDEELLSSMGEKK